jgi:hypothetical protein
MTDRITEAVAEIGSEAYARIEILEHLLAWSYTKLHYRSFDSLEDALTLDKIKLLLEHGIGAAAQIGGV